MPRRVPRVALLTCRHHDHIDSASEGALMQALVRRGAAVLLVAWDDVARLNGSRAAATGVVDEHVDEHVDMMVLRTTWDYWDRLGAFKDFLRSIEAGVDSRRDVLINAPATALANLDKRYLELLAAEGVAVVPTIYVSAGAENEALQRAGDRGWASVVAKPTVGAAGSGLALFETIGAALHEHLITLTAAGEAMLQPYQPRVTTEGETSLVYFEGEFSHAVNKMPARGDFRSQVDFGGVYTLITPTAAQLEVGRTTLDAWTSRFGDRPLYARVDLVPGEDGAPLLGELELIEPELFLDMEPGASDRFAAAILNRLRVEAPVATLD